MSTVELRSISMTATTVENMNDEQMTLDHKIDTFDSGSSFPCCRYDTHTESLVGDSVC